MKLPRSLAAVLPLALAATFASSPASAHCDAMDGPVITLAGKALDKGNVNLVLPWVPARSEPEIRAAFDHTIAVRKLSPEAKHLADTFFFETLVRVHRASEGAAYTGLKPAGIDRGPAIPAADAALAAGSPEAVEKLLATAIHKGLHERLDAAAHAKAFSADDVAAGRRYVQAYVPYVHYVEGLWQAATKAGDEHAEHTAHAH
jgi:hypothetical protein